MFDLFNTTEKLSRGLRDFLKPRKAFTDQTKNTFMAVFDATHPESRRSHRVTVLAKTFIASGALVAIFAGASVYADTANVPADNALYPLKRLSENVQLALTPAPQKAQLQAVFAARRATEISDLSTRKPTSTIIAGLDSDLDSDVDNSIGVAVATDLGDGKLNTFCDKILSAIATSSLALHDRLSIHPQVLAHFEKECAVNTTTTVVIVAPASTTEITATSSGDEPAFTLPDLFSPASPTNTTSTFHASTTFHVRGGGSLNLIFSDPFHGDVTSSDAAFTSTSSTSSRGGRPRSGGDGSRGRR